jgi:hypothetical protein
LKKNHLAFVTVFFVSLLSLAKADNTEKFKKAFNRWLPKIQNCRLEASSANLILAGKIVVDLEINDNASLKRIKINDDQSTLSDLNVQKCVVDVIKKINFPKAAKGKTVSFSYPITFK